MNYPQQEFMFEFYCGPNRWRSLVAQGHQAIGSDESFVFETSIGHGRIKMRYLTLTSELNDCLDFPDIQQVFRLQRLIQPQATGKITYQVIFGITSLSQAHIHLRN